MNTRRVMVTGFWWIVAVAEWLLAMVVFSLRAMRELIFGSYWGPLSPPEFRRYIKVSSLQKAPDSVAGVDSRPRGVWIQLQ